MSCWISTARCWISYYDRHFWHEVVPAAWGSSRGLDSVSARVALDPRFQAVEGTLAWYSIDYWSQELQLDIRALKRNDTTRIGWLPGAREFLRRVRALGKRTVLTTNSHPDVLRIKHESTGRLRRTRRQLQLACVRRAQGAAANSGRRCGPSKPFDPARTLFVDDNVPMLRAARAAGIAHLVAVRRPDSALPARNHDEFASVGGRGAAGLAGARGARAPQLHRQVPHHADIDRHGRRTISL